MTEMARDFFGHNPALAGPLIAMLLFTVVFVLAAVRAMRAERAHVDRLAGLPLDEEHTDRARTEELKETRDA
jgi:hypothetical protein